MRIPDPTPVARGLAVAAASLAGIPAVCRWIEDGSAHLHGYQAIGVAVLAVLVLQRCSSFPTTGERSRAEKSAR